MNSAHAYYLQMGGPLPGHLGSYKAVSQSILKEISFEYSLEGLLLKLKLQYFGQLMRRADSLDKILMLGKIEGEGGGRG